MTIQYRSNDFKTHKCTKTQQIGAMQNALDKIKTVIKKNNIEKIAWETKLIQRTSSKIRGIDFFLALLLSNLDPEHATLIKISDMLTSCNRNLRIKPQSIMERLNTERSEFFFQKIFQEVLNAQINSYSQIAPDLLESFTKILVQDSTSIELNEKLSQFYKGSGGRASKSSAKIDVIYDFKAKKYERIKLTDCSEADQKLSVDILDYLIPNALVIRDLGYLNHNCIRQISDMGAFFLSRIRGDILIYLNESDKEETDLAGFLHEQSRYANVVDVNVCITKSKYKVRLVAYRVPPEVSAIRRRQFHAIAKKQGRTPKQKSLLLLDFNIFITNVPVELWKPEIIGTIYRFRWQIELLYKHWKSTLKIDYLRGVSVYRIRSLIYCRLITVLIFNEIYKVFNWIACHMGRELSMDKLYKWMRCIERVKRILCGSLAWWEERHLSEFVERCLCKQKRKRKTSLQAVFEQDFYYLEAS